MTSYDACPGCGGKKVVKSKLCSQCRGYTRKTGTVITGRADARRLCPGCRTQMKFGTPKPQRNVDRPPAVVRASVGPTAGGGCGGG